MAEKRIPERILDGARPAEKGELVRKLEALQEYTDRLAAQLASVEDAQHALPSLEELRVAEEELRQQGEELIEAREVLEIERARYQDLFEFAPDGYLVTDTVGKIREANRAAAHLFHSQGRFLVGKPLVVFVSVEDRPQFRQRLARLGKEQVAEWTLKFKPQKDGGAVVEVAVKVAPMHSRQEGLVGLRWLLRDITAQKELERELSQARHRLAQIREEERLQLARDLHDGPVQQLLGISYLADEGKRKAREMCGCEHREVFEAILARVGAEMLDTARQLRSAIGDLRPAGLEELGVVAAIEGLIVKIRREGGEDAPEIDLTVLGSEVALPQPVALCLYRVAQEALRNTLKHAKAGQIDVSLCFSQGVTLKVRDDGCGFIVPPYLIALARRNHFGLVGLEEQVSAAGGRMSIASAPQAGSEITVVIPL